MAWPVAVRYRRTTSSRLVYGSDCCWTSPAGVRAALARIKNAPPPEGVDSWAQLMATNAQALLSARSAPAGTPA